MRWATAASRSASSSGSSTSDPLFDPHAAFQHFKRHPFISSILEGGQLVRYGAKALPEGGWNTQPQLYLDGALIVGDAANFVNSMRLKGIHLAMRSGMLAAETAFDAVRAGDTLGEGAGVLQGARRRERRSRTSSIRCATCTRRSARA